MSVRVRGAEAMQNRVPMRLHVEPEYDAVAVLAAELGHPQSCVARTQRRQGIRLRTVNTGEIDSVRGVEGVEGRESCVVYSSCGVSGGEQAHRRKDRGGEACRVL